MSKLNDIVVLKRDGRVMPYDTGKIVNAILKAMRKTDAGEDIALAGNIAAKVGSAVIEKCTEKGTNRITVDQIHDMVERKLMESKRKDVAQEYIRFRNMRNMARKADSIQIFKGIIDAQANDITRENANMNADTPAGMMMKFASEASKTFVDECLLSPEVQLAVKQNIIHIHDKDYYPSKSLTCIQHPTDKLLKEGFIDGHASVRPAKRIETASTVACITMEAVQNEMHGGQAIPAFDFYMAPFVRSAYEEEVEKICQTEAADLSLDDKARNYIRMTLLTLKIKDYLPKDLPSSASSEGMDKLVEDIPFEVEYYRPIIAYLRQLAVNRTVKRVHQSMESFVHNMNTIHSRGGNQVVFSSINYGTDTSAEGRCIIREMLNTTFEGVGNGETAIFPIQIWKKKRGVSYLPGDPNYDLYRYACKVTAKRFFPNFVNLDATYNQDPDWDPNDPKRYIHEVATMGCRTRVFENRFGPRTSIGRGNISFTTINLPGLALSCMSIPGEKERVSEFMKKLSETADLVALQLEQRYRFQATALAKQFPMLMSGLWIGSENLKPNDRVGDVINQGTLGVGFIGLAEALIALVGKHHAEDAGAQELGLKIVRLIKERVDVACEKYKHNYSVLATPAEGLAGRFTKIDKILYGIVPGVTDKDYYTNSNHVPVYFHCTPEYKAKIEAPYHELTRGGHIFYVEMDGDATHNPEAIMAVVDLMDKYNIGYGSVNHNRNRCLDCGYEDASKDLKKCPKCGSERIDTLQRITGYLVGTTERWNSGKKAELRDRVVHGGGRSE